MTGTAAQAATPAAERLRRLRARRRRRIVYVAPVEISVLHLGLLYAAGLIDQAQKQEGRGSAGRRTAARREAVPSHSEAQARGGSVLAMARRPAVTQADLTRCLKAAMAAGVNAGRMEIQPGKVVVIFTKSPVSPEPADDLDAELEQFEKAHGED